MRSARGVLADGYNNNFFCFRILTVCTILLRHEKQFKRQARSHKVYQRGYRRNRNRKFYPALLGRRMFIKLGKILFCIPRSNFGRRYFIDRQRSPPSHQRACVSGTIVCGCVRVPCMYNLVIIIIKPSALLSEMIGFFEIELSLTG